MNMEVFEIIDSNISSKIPIEFGRMKRLNTLSLYCNKLIGTVPTELGKLVNLGKTIVSFLCGPLNLLF
jgi:LRR receptor-like serine/threonine-protein kinase FLS2